MTLFIKNMVCARCIRTVSRLVLEGGFDVKSIQLGEVEIAASPDAAMLATLRQKLESEGFELLDDRNSRLVAQIKGLIVSEIHHGAAKKPDVMNFSDFLSRTLGVEYSQMSKLFSSVEGLTIEKYIIAQKIERVKELLVYDEMNLADIAWQMGYSSTQYLSNQFRQVTGLTPTKFKANHQTHTRKHLDMI